MLERQMAKLALAGLVAAATLISAGPGQAASVLFGSPLDTAPWCVVYNMGADIIHEGCTYSTFEACNQERMLQGSTAFCRQNPAFPGYYAQPGRTPKARKHRKARR
jgi:hypothetical protein